MKRKTFIYARVSTAKQKPDLENQISLLKQFCFSNGYTISEIYSDIASGISFEKRKDLYYDNLNSVRVNNDMTHWIKYFLVGVEQTASLASQTLSNILRFKEDIENHVRANYGRRSSNAILLIHQLMRNPMVTVDDAARMCDTSYKSANEIIKLLCADGYLVESTGQSRNRLFHFKPYTDIFVE